VTITTKHTQALKLNIKKSRSILTFTTPAWSADVVLCPENSATAHFKYDEPVNIQDSDLNLACSSEEFFCPPTAATTIHDQEVIIDELKKIKPSKKTQPIYQNPAAELKKISDEILSIK